MSSSIHNPIAFLRSAAGKLIDPGTYVVGDGDPDGQRPANAPDPYFVKITEEDGQQSKS